MKKRKRKAPVKTARKGRAPRRVHRNPLPPEPPWEHTGPTTVYTDADIVYELGDTRPDGTQRPEGYRNWYIVAVKTDKQMNWEYDQFNQGLCFARSIYKYRDLMHAGETLLFSMHSPEGSPKLFFDIHPPALDCSSIRVDNTPGETHSNDCPARRGTLHCSQIKGNGNRRPGEYKNQAEETRMCIQFLSSLGIDPTTCENLKKGLAVLDEVDFEEARKREIELARAEGRLPIRGATPEQLQRMRQEIVERLSQQTGWPYSVIAIYGEEPSPTTTKWTFPDKDGQPRYVVVVRWDPRAEYDDFLGAFVLSFSQIGQRGGSKLTMLDPGDIARALALFERSGGRVPDFFPAGTSLPLRVTFVEPAGWYEAAEALVPALMDLRMRYKGYQQNSPTRLRIESNIDSSSAVIRWLPSYGVFAVDRRNDVGDTLPELNYPTYQEAVQAAVNLVQSDLADVLESSIYDILVGIESRINSGGAIHVKKSYIEKESYNGRVTRSAVVVAKPDVYNSRNVEVVQKPEFYQIRFNGGESNSSRAYTVEQAIEYATRWIQNERRMYPWGDLLERTKELLTEKLEIRYSRWGRYEINERPGSGQVRVVSRDFRNGDGDNGNWLTVDVLAVSPMVKIDSPLLPEPQFVEVDQYREVLNKVCKDINRLLDDAEIDLHLELTVWANLGVRKKATEVLAKLIRRMVSDDMSVSEQPTTSPEPYIVRVGDLNRNNEALGVAQTTTSFSNGYDRIFWEISRPMQRMADSYRFVPASEVVERLLAKVQEPTTALPAPPASRTPTPPPASTSRRQVSVVRSPALTAADLMGRDWKAKIRTALTTGFYTGRFRVSNSRTNRSVVNITPLTIGYDIGSLQIERRTLGSRRHVFEVRGDIQGVNIAQSRRLTSAMFADEALHEILEIVLIFVQHQNSQHVELPVQQEVEQGVAAMEAELAQGEWTPVPEPATPTTIQFTTEQLMQRLLEWTRVAVETFNASVAQRSEMLNVSDAGNTVTVGHPGVFAAVSIFPIIRPDEPVRWRVYKYRGESAPTHEDFVNDFPTAALVFREAVDTELTDPIPFGIGFADLATVWRGDTPRRNPSAASQLSPNQQKKYLAGLKGKAREKRAEEILYRRTHRSNKPFATDKGRKTKRSEHTIAFEQIYGRPAHDVADAARLTGVPRDILEKVYAKGMAAWQTGHRPGASQHAWAMARVYSFVTGGRTQETADRKLAVQAGIRRNPMAVWDWINMGGLAMGAASLYATHQRRNDLARIEAKVDKLSRNRKR